MALVTDNERYKMNEWNSDDETRHSFELGFNIFTSNPSLNNPEISFKAIVRQNNFPLYRFTARSGVYK